MSVFDGSTKVNLQVSDPGTDKSMPDLGALALAAMTSPSALPGCTGLEAGLIKGDQWDIIQGNRQVMIMQDWTQTTIGSKTCTVLQNRTNTTVSNVTDTTVGSTLDTNLGATVNTWVAAEVATHAANQMRFEPVTFMHMIVSKLWAGNSLSNIGMLYFQFYVNYTSITPTYINLTPALNFAVTGINIHFEGFDNGSRALQNKLAAMQSQIDGMEMEAELLELGTQTAISVLALAVNSICM